jgi:3-hydroxyacyl-[acyl-carrier-protein] dehydratase
MFDADLILDALPHRPPFRFLTSIETLESESSGRAIWHVTGTEAFLTGHFPGEPIVPGVLIVEALAQLSGLVGFYRGLNSPGDSTAPQNGRLAHVDVRFDDSVIPPAEIILMSRQARVFGALRQFEVEAAWKEKRVARGRLTLAVHAAATESER